MDKLLEKKINDIKREKTTLRKVWSNSFLNELDVILEKCFLRHKSKKEHFITKDKIELELIKLLQSQKKFLTRDSFRCLLTAQAVFDKEENAVGKILNINFLTKEVEALSIFNQKVVRPFDEVIFFDVYSLECVVMFEKQKLVNDNFTYKDTYRFLTHIEKPVIKKTANYFVFDQKVITEA